MLERKTIHLDPAIETEVMDLLQEGQNLLAIKGIVDAAGVSFADATAWVDQHFRQQVVPCPFCGKPLRTNQAKQCFECGMDWHDGNYISRK